MEKNYAHSNSFKLKEEGTFEKNRFAKRLAKKLWWGWNTKPKVISKA